MIDIKEFHDRMAGAMADEGWPEPFVRFDDPPPSNPWAHITWIPAKDIGNDQSRPGILRHGERQQESGPVRNAVSLRSEIHANFELNHEIYVIGCFRDTGIIVVNGSLVFDKPNIYAGRFRTFGQDIRWLVEALNFFSGLIKR